MGNRGLSNERMAREKLWYFSEESVKSFSPILEDEDPGKLDSYKKIIREKNDYLVPKAIGKNRSKRECTFVVDWQLSDSF